MAKHKIKKEIQSGLSFGLTSGVITTLGLMVGLNSGTHSRLAVIGGILTIAFADAMSDALGMHVSTEGEENNKRKIWKTTSYTFLSKLIVALTFLIPVLFFKLDQAIIIGIIWGLTLLGILSYKVAKARGTNPKKVISEHILIAIIVIALSQLIGGWVSKIFGSI